MVLLLGVGQVPFLCGRLLGEVGGGAVSESRSSVKLLQISDHPMPPNVSNGYCYGCYRVTFLTGRPGATRVPWWASTEAAAQEKTITNMSLNADIHTPNKEDGAADTAPSPTAEPE